MPSLKLIVSVSLFFVCFSVQAQQKPYEFKIDIKDIFSGGSQVAQEKPARDVIKEQAVEQPRKAQEPNTPSPGDAAHGQPAKQRVAEKISNPVASEYKKPSSVEMTGLPMSDKRCQNALEENYASLPSLRRSIKCCWIETETHNETKTGKIKKTKTVHLGGGTCP